MSGRFKTTDKSEVLWKTSTHGFYGNFMGSFCFKVILFYCEDMKARRYISFTKNAEDFTSNNFLRCAQVKKLKRVTLFSYERKKKH